MADLPPGVHCYDPRKSRSQSETEGNTMRFEKEYRAPTDQHKIVDTDREQDSPVRIQASEEEPIAVTHANSLGLQDSSSPPDRSSVLLSALSDNKPDTSLPRPTRCLSENISSTSHCINLTSPAFDLVNNGDLTSSSIPPMDVAPRNFEESIVETTSRMEKQPLNRQARNFSTSNGTVLYGFDVGYPDPDIENGGCCMILDFNPPEQMSALDYGELLEKESIDKELRHKSPKSNRGAFHSKPLSIRIPRFLVPLPDVLLKSSTRLLYFHHFINITAGLLVAHDCSKNPFRIILPSCK